MKKTKEPRPKCREDGCDKPARGDGVRCREHAKAWQQSEVERVKAKRLAMSEKAKDPIFKAQIEEELTKYEGFIHHIATRNIAKYFSTGTVSNYESLANQGVGRLGFNIEDMVQELRLIAFEVLANFDPEKCPEGRTKEQMVKGAIGTRVKAISNVLQSESRGLFENHESDPDYIFNGSSEYDEDKDL
jgi:hypothetical protein